MEKWMISSRMLFWAFLLSKKVEKKVNVFLYFHVFAYLACSRSSRTFGTPFIQKMCSISHQSTSFRRGPQSNSRGLGPTKKWWNLEKKFSIALKFSFIKSPEKIILAREKSSGEMERCFRSVEGHTDPKRLENAKKCKNVSNMLFLHDFPRILSLRASVRSAL